MDKKIPDLVRPGLWAGPRQLKEIKRKLREKVPKISLYDIRVERHSYHEAVLSDLYESGYKQSALFIEDLIEMEDAYRASNKLPESYLKANAGKDCLATIAEYMKIAELKVRSGKKVNSVEIVLELARQLASQENQLWIVEQIYISSIRTTKMYRLDGGLLEARVRYYYGRFLVERGGLYDLAYEILNVAHNMSIARDWTIQYESGAEKQLCKEVSYLLFLCLSHRETDQPQSVALDYSKKALKYALASENKYIIPRAYLERGDVEMQSKNYDDAVKYYSKAITFAQISNQSEYICQGYLKKGVALQKHGQISRATTFAKLAKRAAEDSNSKYYLAKSYILYGEIAVGRQFMNMAGYNFMAAADIFLELDDVNLAREARFLGAFAISHLVLEKIVDLIRKTGRSRFTEGFDRLVQWKERLIPFWEYGDDNLSLRRFSDSSETEKGKSTLTAFGHYESISMIKHKASEHAHSGVYNIHIFREFRQWLSTY